VFAALAPFRDKCVIPRLVADETGLRQPFSHRRVEAVPLVPLALGHVIDPGLLLLPEIDYPEQVACVEVAVTHRIGHLEVRGIPALFLRVLAYAFRLDPSAR
jgi:hypothetical protein